MLCTSCGWDNLPGEEICAHCQQDMTLLTQPVPANHIERSLMEDTAGDLGLQLPQVIRLETPVRQAIAHMLQRNIGALLVVDDAGQLQGIFSERDLLKKIAGIHEALGDIHIGAFMTSRPETVSPDDTLAVVLHKMDTGGYRHVPVVAQGKPVGILSVRDMLKHITKLSRGE